MLVIPVYNTIVLPEVQYNLESGFLNEKEAEELSINDYVIISVLKESKSREKLSEEDFYSVGMIGKIKYLKENEDGVFITVRTGKRVKIKKLTIGEEGIDAEYEELEDLDDLSASKKKAAINVAVDLINELTRESFFEYRDRKISDRFESVNEIMSIIGPYTDLTAEEKYAMLAIDSLKERTSLMMKAISRYKDIVGLQREINRKLQEKSNEDYREGIIRRQIEGLQEELDSFHPEMVSDLKRIEEKLQGIPFTEEVKKEVDRVLKRFKNLNKDDHEYATTLDYLEFISELCWGEEKTPEIDIKKAKEVLDKSHYGLKKAKNRIIEQMAVMALKKKNSGSLLLLVGAPGTGKTSLGKAIAEALGRKYIRISLGGIKDEAEIRGHRRTYVGAMPGRIMDAIKKSGVNNPVIVLDEVDKLGRGSFNGDPESALLEVLDPEQNSTFTDHYMNVPYDLSNVLFICTANSTEDMSEPLLDRMEEIEISGYTAKEKYKIAKEYLLPKALEEAGLFKKNVGLSDVVIKKIISDYTMEAGVRGLKKQLDKIMRYVAVKILEEEKEKISIKQSDLIEILGSKKAFHENVLKHRLSGVVTGLAWTQAGGEILFIETTAMNGNGNIIITGQLGDVMKESANIAVNLVKSFFYERDLNFKERDIHIHVPAGAVPKDGPSAGITMFTAIASLVTGNLVDPYLAMTGELSLRGKVLPIGGLTEKLMAAERSGIKKVLIPLENKDDLKEVPQETKDNLEIVLVDTIEEVAKEALGMQLKFCQKKFFEEQKRKKKDVVSKR